MCDPRRRRGYNAHRQPPAPMRIRTRILVVALFAALFAALPAPDADHGVPYAAWLRVREWLLAESTSPLAPWRQAGTVPPLAVDLRQSPPIEDAALRRAREAEFARCGAEWAAAEQLRGRPTTIDASRGSLPLLVHIGQRGVRAELAQPDGRGNVFEAPLPSRWSLLPAVLAIAAAVLFRSVLLALALGCLGGAIVFVATPLAAPPGPLQAIWHGAVHFVVDALWRRSICGDFQLAVTGFVGCLFLTVAIVARNGGVQGVVAWLQRRVAGPVGAQLCTFATGVVMFFDDYSSCLVTGTTMRPLCDHNRVSREKLAWIVDSTAAPIAGLSVFSTWIAYEVSQYSAQLTLVTRADGTPYRSSDGYEVFLASLPFRFYSLFTLALVLLVILGRRDFGPMLAAERRARHLGQPSSPTARPLAGTLPGSDLPAVGARPAAHNAIVPLAVLVLGAPILMLLFGAADSMVALLLAATGSCLTAVALSLAQRLLTCRELLRTALQALRALVPAFAVLFLAWALGHLCQDLGTSTFLAASVRGAAAAIALPLLLFAVAGLVAFTTGTSFGTMAILLPNVVLLAHHLGAQAAFGGTAAAGGPALMLVSIAAVLEGAIFGDHCSPTSDTTLLSSLGAQCDHLAHVQTQLPYALLGFLVALVCGYTPVVLLGPDAWWLSLGLGLTVLALVLRSLGRDPDRPGAG
jgi:Na+/H+ antiporter NhaC